MSTLKTHNLQSPDAGSVNIAMTPNAGMVVAGVSTYSNKLNVGSKYQTRKLLVLLPHQILEQVYLIYMM